MIILPKHLSVPIVANPSDQRRGERGAALAIAILMMVLLSAIAIGVLAVVQVESKIAGSDLKRTEACYASAVAIERMTNDFSSLFAHTSRPNLTQLHKIELSYPAELTSEGYAFPDHTIALNSASLAAMGNNPSVTIPYGPFGGLIANLKPYTLTTTAQSSTAQCKLSRDMNNYLIPLFQFGMFSDQDIELHPGPPFTFNGRVHANGNIYVNGSVKFLAKVTTANEFIFDVLRNGSTRSGATVSMQVGSINVAVTRGSMTNGPNLTSATANPAGQRGYFPTSPNGTINASWNSTSVAAASAGTANQFGGQLLTRTTGAAPLKLPLQLDNNPTRELIKRRMPNDSPDPTAPTALGDSRYHSKSEIRILIDDEAPSTTDASGIPAGQGVALSTFDPIMLPNSALNSLPTANGGGRALWGVNDINTSFSNSYNETASSFVLQTQNGTAGRQADTVRGVRIPVTKAITGVTKTNPISITSTGHGFVTGDLVVIGGVGGTTAANNTATAPNIYWVITVVNANTFTLNGSLGLLSGAYTLNTGTVYALPKSANGTVIPSGSGITGRILIQIVDTNGNIFDVTSQILSLGMTEGEPNSIVQLQRPLWAAFTQGSRDASSPTGTNYLSYILNSTTIGADGEISVDSTHPSLANGYLTAITNDTTQRADTPPSNSLATLLSGTAGANWASWNALVPINVYNVREGHLKTSVSQNAVYERGITNIVELNMRNLARWLDGVYDQNLLANTNAVSTNIGKPDGYVVYVSDRRGDKVRSMVDSTGATINSSNGMVDNEDIYGSNGVLDGGEDVQNTGALVKDVTECPDPAVLTTNPSYGVDRVKRAIAVAAWSNGTGPNHNYFRNSVRLFNGESLQVTGAAGKLSTTLGITVATENMVYIWGNYNTTGINVAPASGSSSLNDPTAPSHYLPTATDTQVPASIVADAFFPLSKTWFDSSSALNPDDYTARRADKTLPNVTAETSVRAGIIAGNNLSALSGTPDADNGADSRLSGGMHNFPRFLEDWVSDDRRWNFVGSFVPLYHSTQAVGQWWYITSGVSIYGAPVRNWAFDTTFLQLDRLPPGTPMFQYISPTAFRQVL
ncbi:MAG: hypothetical protein JWM21_2082 [Acidobacteria bacterium]|nr:hypothetical protein [Acidobacteriota bacterium]